MLQSYTNYCNLLAFIVLHRGYSEVDNWKWNHRAEETYSEVQSDLELQFFY